MVFIRSMILPRSLLRGLIAFLTACSSVGVRPGQKGFTAFALKHWATPPCDTFLNRRLGRDQRCHGIFGGPAHGIPSLSSEWPRLSTPSQERATFNILQPCVRSTLVATRASWELSGEGEEERDALLLWMIFEGVEAEDLREWIQRYPFGVALPVQPFSLVETKDGVDIVFRKKPTLGRGSKDGGLSFVVKDTSRPEGGDLPAGPTLSLRRISDGQEIRKVFAERIVVKAVVRSFAGEGAPSAPMGTKVCAVIHEGLL